MTLIDVMDVVADKVEKLLDGYNITVYRGYPSPKEEQNTPDYVCVLPQKFYCGNDGANVELMIGVNVKDDAKDEMRGAGIRTMLNILEHLRQGLTKERTLSSITRLELPINGEFPANVRDLYPFWVGWLIVKYSLAAPTEEIESLKE